HGPGGGAVDLATLPASLLDRLVISRGVLGAQFGAGALGGVVELVPRRPRTDRPVADARLSAGSFGTFGASSSASVPWSSEGGGLVALQVDRSAGDFPYRRPDRVLGARLVGPRPHRAAWRLGVRRLRRRYSRLSTVVPVRLGGERRGRAGSAAGRAPVGPRLGDGGHGSRDGRRHRLPPPRRLLPAPLRG